MAVLTSEPTWEGVTFFPGAERVLSAQGSALPQTDQFCGPFAAWAALHAVLDAPPSIHELAVAARTRVWPHDVAAWRPQGSPLVTTGWESVPRAEDPESSGTDATGVVEALSGLCGGSVTVESLRGPDWTGLGPLLSAAVQASESVAIIANVRTGPIAPPRAPWDVGHFVVLLGVADGGRVAIADSYAELGARGAPPGCRLVSVAALVAALSAPPGRSLIVVRPSRE